MRLALVLAVVPSLALALALVPAAAAQAPPARHIDITITLPADGAPTMEGPSGILAYANRTTGEWAQWRLASDRAQVSVELRIEGGFAVERARQVVPLLILDKGERTCVDVRAKGACDDTLFVPYPNDRVWEAEGAARVYALNGTPEHAVLRLSIPGPVNGTLALGRDVTAPVVTLSAPTNVNHFSFFDETTTDELAIVDLQVRKEGATEWVVNPTPDLNLRQKFPIQGLSPNTSYEYRFVARDWAQNEVTSPVYRLRTAPAPIVEVPIVTAMEPAPNATVAAGEVFVRAAVESASKVDPASVRLFLDKTAITQGVRFDGANVTYTPTTPLAPGKHSLSVEATNAAGGTGLARWSFTIPGAQATPAPAPLLVLAALAAVAVVARRR